jgi:2-keto-4-pentenoate hydratase/2-oxohepta-3-ene-1,7-dioic acid hydratase in catechol pathway
MKLVRHGPTGGEKPGMIDPAGVVRDLSGVVPDIDGKHLSTNWLEKLRSVEPSSLPLVKAGTRLGAPVANVGKIVAVGLNYSDHAAESGMKPPAEPILFMKATSSITGPHDTVMIPRGSQKTDWEVELAFVVGTQARYVPDHDALKHVAGYMICNDVSERSFQLERGGQWDKGKGCDTFAPIGPWLVTPDEAGDPQSLDMWLDLNGERMQAGNTRTMIFGVAHLLSYISHFMTLNPGDVVTTGTPPGVGMAKKPPRFLKAGDVMTLGIARLGEQRQNCVAFA